MSVQLTVSIGDVVRLQCTHCNPPKLKYYVILQTEPLLRAFMINTELTRFQASSPTHVEFNPIIRAAEHTFLAHDSYIGCDHISHEHTLASVTKELQRDPTCLLGHLSDDAKESIKAGAFLLDVTKVGTLLTAAHCTYRTSGIAARVCEIFTI